MNKGEFVEALADRLDVSRAQADRALSAVLDIIAEQLGVQKANVHLKSGHSSRRKVIEVEAPPADVEQRLGAAAALPA